MNADISVRSFSLLHSRLDEGLLKEIHQVLDSLRADTEKEAVLEILSKVARLIPKRENIFNPELSDRSRRSFNITQMLRKI